MQTNKKQSDYEGAEEEHVTLKVTAIKQKDTSAREYIQFWNSCKVVEGLIDEGPYVEIEEKYGLSKLFAGIQDDVIKMQYENGDDVENEWTLESMEPDTYVLILPVEEVKKK